MSKNVKVYKPKVSLRPQKEPPAKRSGVSVSGSGKVQSAAAKFIPKAITNKRVRDARYRLRQRGRAMLAEAEKTGDATNIAIAKQQQQMIERLIAATKASKRVRKSDLRKMDEATRERVKQLEAKQIRQEKAAQEKFLKVSSQYTKEQLEKDMNKDVMTMRKLTHPKNDKERLQAKLFYALTKDVWMGAPPEKRNELIIRALGVPDLATAYRVVVGSLNKQKREALQNLGMLDERETKLIHDWEYGKDTKGEADTLIYQIMMSSRNSSAIPWVLDPDKVAVRRKRYGLA